MAGTLDDLTDEYDRQLMETVALGEEAKQFLNTKLAQYIINAAELKVVTAQQELTTVDPTSTKEIIRLQGIVKQFDHFQQCLEQLVASGDSAYQLYLGNNEQ